MDDHENPLDELSRRRAWAFEEGWPVRLGNGQDWHLRIPRPFLATKLNSQPYGPNLDIVWSLGPGLETASAIFTETWQDSRSRWPGDGDGAGLTAAYAESADLAFMLLDCNYDVSYEEWVTQLYGKADPAEAMRFLAFMTGSLGALYCQACRRWHALTRPAHAGLASASGVPRLDPALN